MPLTAAEKRQLRQRAHSLKPLVTVGANGINEGLLRELDLTLEHHELVKVRVRADDRDERTALIAHLCSSSGSELVQQIGHIALLFRPAKEVSAND